MPEGFTNLPFGAALFDRLLKLNNAHSKELSFASEEHFRGLMTRASFVRAEASGLAFMIGFHEACDYDGSNFMWLKERFARFNYVDRVVVAEAARGKGLARAFYAAFEADALAHGRKHLVCEVNLEPANPVSDQFHLALGFKPVGQQALEGTGKTVRYWAKDVG